MPDGFEDPYKQMEIVLRELARLILAGLFILILLLAAGLWVLP